MIDAFTTPQVYVRKPMHDKPQAAPAQEFALPGHAALALSGRDAVGFAQAQFMNDVTVLADGQWQWNGWLTPKGRVIALFALLRLDAETLWLVLLPEADAAGLAARLQRFVFRSKVTLAPLAMPVAGCFAAVPAAAGARMGQPDEGRLALDVGGDGGPRTLLLGGAPAPADPQAEAAWLRADLAHGLPWLPAAQTEQWTPQQLSLDRLAAFSVKKGCYPGQEIVARTHFLGQAKRGLVLLEGDVPLAAGAELRRNDQPLGSVVSSAGTLSLAVLPLGHGDGIQGPGGVPLREQSLLAGLAR